MRLTAKQKAIDAAKYLKSNDGTYEIELKEGSERNNFVNYISTIGDYDSMKFTTRRVDDQKVIVLRIH